MDKVKYAIKKTYSSGGFQGATRQYQVYARLAWHGPPRFCACGQQVSRYKNPKAEFVQCYQCEDKMPWSFERIARGGIC